MERNGYLEETYFTFSYSSGVFSVPALRTPNEYCTNRRLPTLHELAACEISASTLASNPDEVPFATKFSEEFRISVV